MFNNILLSISTQLDDARAAILEHHSADVTNPTPARSEEKKDLIETHIQEGNYQEALNKLLFQLLDPKILNLEKTFEHLFALFPHIDEDDKSFGTLLQRLPNFLNLTSHLSEQQNRLALLLGKSHEKRKAYLEAMSCFAQALKIGEQRKDLEMQIETHF